MSMEAVEFILYVEDLLRSKEFYAKLLQREPVLDVEGMVEFLLADNVKLGLMPEEGVFNLLEKKIMDPQLGNGIPRCELYLRFDDVRSRIKAVLGDKVQEISSLRRRDWGDDVAYISDPDGHIIALVEK